MIVAYPRIVATAPVDDVAERVLGEFGKFEVAPDTSEETLMSLLDGTLGIVVRGEGKAPASIIESAKDLKVIGRPGAGYDSVDIKAATARGIPVVYAPGQGAAAVAEGAMALLLTLVKKIPLFDQAVKSGNWNERYETMGRDMEGSTLGIIGLGQIGAKTARLAQAFGAKVISYDPMVDAKKAAEVGVEMVSVEKLFAESDYISVHAPLADATRGIVSRKLLATTKPGAILINTARGGLVESLDVLLDELNSGRLSAVGLDVFPTEPPDISHPIFKHPNCLTTPHAIGITSGVMERLSRVMAEGMAAVLRGDRPEFVVNPEVFK